MSQALDFETQLHTVPIRNKKLIVSPSDRDPDAVLVGAVVAGLI